MSGLKLDFTGKVALVTGATRNIGFAVAERLASAGANLAITGSSDPNRLAGAVASLRELGVNASGRIMDAGNPDSIGEALDGLQNDLGRIDILINNAAIRPHSETQDITVEDWDRVINVNLRGPFLLCQRLLPSMRAQGYGRVINISGLDAFWSKAGRPHVISTKAGIIGLTRALAAENALAGITVNAVVPGTINTERHTPSWYPDLDAFYAARTSRIPMGRLGEPSEVADVVLFLASELSSYMTGQVLFATGGAYPMVREGSDEPE